VPVGEVVTLGRIFNLLGEVIDEATQIAGHERWPIHRDAPAVTTHHDHRDVRTGIKVVDMAWRPRKGGRSAFGGPASADGDIQELSHTWRRSTAASAFCGVGERSAGGQDLWLEMKEVGVIDKTMIVFGQMNEPPGARMRGRLRADPCRVLASRGRTCCY